MDEDLVNGPRRAFTDLVFEKIPPFLGYMMILFPLVASYFIPNVVGIYLIIIFVYFFYKSLSSCVQFAIGLWKIKQGEITNWKKLVDGLKDPTEQVKVLKAQLNRVKKISYKDFDKEDMKDGLDDIAIERRYSGETKLPGMYRRILYTFEKRKTIAFIKKHIRIYEKLQDRNLLSPNEIQHIIIIPFVNEPIELLQKSIDRLKSQTFNTKQISVVLAIEMRVENSWKVAEELKKRNEQFFNHIWITKHIEKFPDVIGKSANMNWACRRTYEEVTKLGWDLEKTTITSCDSDSKIDLQYYAAVTFKYITEKDAKYKIFTAALVFYNNIWRLPFYARVKNSFSSIYNVSKMARPDKLVPVSTYTVSLWMVKEIDFWTPWITPEDYHIFFKCLFKFDRKVGAVPIYLITMSDAAEGKGHWDTIRNNYMQSRRWAWGISDTGWMLKQFVKNFFRHSLRTKYKTMHVIFDHITGPNIALLIMIGGNIPVWLNPDFGNEVFGTLLPTVTSAVVRVTLIFLIIIILLDFYLKPRPEDYPWWRRITRIVEWISQPIGGFLLAALPGIESQTRLIFGRYMEYYVTKKLDDKEEKK